MFCSNKYFFEKNKTIFTWSFRGYKYIFCSTFNLKHDLPKYFEIFGSVEWRTRLPDKKGLLFPSFGHFFHSEMFIFLAPGKFDILKQKIVRWLKKEVVVTFLTKLKQNKNKLSESLKVTNFEGTLKEINLRRTFITELLQPAI